MAKVKDIINARSYLDDGLPRKFTDVIDTTRGLTDELYTNNVLKNLGTVPAWITGEGIAIADEPKIPTLSEIIKAAGIKDDAKGSKGERSALDKFLEDFTDPEKREKMRSNIESDEKLGELGWETAKDLWKQATLDKMNSEISEGYEKTLKEGSSTARIPLVGDVEMGDLGKALSIAGTYAQKFFTPRRYEAFARGEDPTWKDNIGDLAESGLMMVPATKYAKAFSKILGPARKILENKVASNVVGNSLAPILSEAMDDVMRDEDDPNTERQDFSIGDAAMGALTNLGVNQGLARILGASGRIGTGELTSGSGGGMRRAAIKMIENMGKSRNERGLGSALPEFVQNAMDKLPNNRVSSIIGGGLKGLDKSLDILGMGAPTLLVNRYGTDKDAKIGAALFNMVGASGIDPVKAIEEIRDDKRTDMRNRKAAKEMEGILKASDVLGLDSRDIGYIKAVQEDPSILTRGIAGKEGDDFKIWLLEKGHRLLRGTSAHRPLWDVE
jgi:hypothetical protein